MKPIEFEGCNVTIAKDQPQYQPLPAMISEDKKTVITEWQVSDEEKLAIVNGANIRLSIMTFGKPLQPLLLETSKIENPEPYLMKSQMPWLQGKFEAYQERMVKAETELAELASMPWWKLMLAKSRLLKFISQIK